MTWEAAHGAEQNSRRVRGRDRGPLAGRGLRNPPEKFIAQANLTDKTVLERFSLDNFPDCFKEYADLLDWYRTWDVMLGEMTIDAVITCVDSAADEPSPET